MIRSMTGYGRASFAVADLGFEVEIRTVNHRYLDARVKLPRMLAGREAEVKARVQGRLGRGKVDLNVGLAPGSSSSPKLEIDLGVAEQYLGAARDLGGSCGLVGELDVISMLGLPGVARFVDPELPSEALAEALKGAVDAALEEVERMRAAEGENLARELYSRLERVESLCVSFQERSGQVQQAVRDRLRKRSEQLRQETGILDEARLHQEIAIAIDRLDVSEELVRLRSHVDQFREITRDADEAKPVGRRLDFLLQEMAREANTVGSKANDAPLAHQVVELKAELERIREQVQNVE
jgi:uncharacterized protein (TIGR00255 family)